MVKFFGNMGHSRPQQMLEEYGSVVVLILRLAAGTLDMGDPTLQMVAIQTVAHIGSSPEGKLSLAKCSKSVWRVSSCWRDLDMPGAKFLWCNIKGQYDWVRLSWRSWVQLQTMEPAVTPITRSLHPVGEQNSGRHLAMQRSLVQLFSKRLKALGRMFKTS